MVINELKEKISNFIFTKGQYYSGTERCSANIKKIKKKYRGYMIVSCDFPFISIKNLNKVFFGFNKILEKKGYAGATIHTNTYDKKIIESKKIPKIVLDSISDIIYFSRNPIPSNYKKKLKYLVHHGPVCLKYNVLKNFFKLKNSDLALSEENEWLGLIENGLKIR